MDQTEQATDITEQTHLTLAEFDDPGAIERVEEGESVRYTNILLLAPGIWGDSGTQRHFLYSEDTLEMLADNIESNTANLFHERDNETVQVGEFDPESVYLGDDDGGLYADVVLSRDNDASRMADELLQQALESGGREGLQGPSLEIEGEEYEFNADEGVHELVDGNVIGLAFVGLGVTPGPGSEDAAFAEQTRNRAVALARTDGAIVLTHEDHELMDADEIRAQLEEHGIQLADDVDVETLQTLAETFLQDEDEEEEEVEDDDGDEEEEEEVEDEDEDEDDIDINLEDVATRVEENSTQIGELNEKVDTIAEATEVLQSDNMDLSELAESVESLSESFEGRGERVDELESKLSELSETLEEPTSLASAGEAEPNEEDDIALQDWTTHPTGSGAYAKR